MKRAFFYFLTVLSVMILATACSKDDDFNPDNQNSDEIQYDGNRKILITYFSATGNTQRLAEQIIAATGADAFRIEAAEPYATNPYDDSDRIQNESYNNLRPGVATLPENVEEYDVIFVGSPIWWHNPAMVVWQERTLRLPLMPAYWPHRDMPVIASTSAAVLPRTVVTEKRPKCPYLPNRPIWKRS